MKILFIDFAKRFGNIIGGQERVVLSLAWELKYRGHEPFFLLRESSELSKRLDNLEVNYLIKDINKYFIRFQLGSIVKFIKDHKIEKIICMDSFANRVGYFLSLRLNKSELYAFRFDVYESPFMSSSLRRRKRLYRKLDSRVLPLFKKIFCISGEIMEEVKAINISKQKIIRFKPGIESHLNLGEFIINHGNIIKLLSLGRFEEEKKGFITLIKACQQLRDKDINNFKLTIAGDGPDRELLIDSGKDLIKDGLFELLPYQSNPGELYKKNDIFILTSKYEGFPFVIPEAMSNYCAVISTRIPELTDQFKENTEVLFFDFHDSSSLAEKLELLITNITLRETLQKRAKIISEDFKMERVISELIKEIL